MHLIGRPVAARRASGRGTDPEGDLNASPSMEDATTPRRELIALSPTPVDRSETVDVDDGFGEGVGCLLRHVVTDPQSPVGVFARELIAVS